MAHVKPRRRDCTDDSQSNDHSPAHYAKTCCKRKSSQYADLGWKRTMAEVLEGMTVSFIIFLLVIIDLFCTIAEDVVDHTTLLNPAHEESFKHVADVATVISFVLLSIFLVEQIALIVCLNCSFFFNAWHVCDLVVVTVSFTLEIIDKAWDEEDTKGLNLLAGFLVLLRLWKVVDLVFEVILLKHQVEEYITKNQVDSEVQCDLIFEKADRALQGQDSAVGNNDGEEREKGEASPGSIRL